MSALGHWQICRQLRDFDRRLGNVRFVPIADIEGLREQFQTNAGVRGRTILTSVKSPGSVSTSIEPACCFTMTS